MTNLFSPPMSAAKSRTSSGSSTASFLDKRDRPKSEWLLTAGRNVAHLSPVAGRGNRAQLTVTDIWSQKPLYQTELSDKVRILGHRTQCGRRIGTHRPIPLDRRRDRQSRHRRKARRPASISNFHTLRSGDDLFVFITGPPQPQVRTITQAFDYPIINGPVYAFNMKTGKPLWPGPATRAQSRNDAHPATRLPFLGLRRPSTSSQCIQRERRPTPCALPRQAHW